jgi:hypothetical protein
VRYALNELSPGFVRYAVPRGVVSSGVDDGAQAKHATTHREREGRRGRLKRGRRSGSRVGVRTSAPVGRRPPKARQPSSHGAATVATTYERLYAPRRLSVCDRSRRRRGHDSARASQRQTNVKGKGKKGARTSQDAALQVVLPAFRLLLASSQEDIQSIDLYIC